MTELIILSRGDIMTLCKDEPVKVWIDKRPILICSDEYFERQKGKEQEKVDDWRDRLDELEREEYYESKYGKEQE